ELPQQLRNLFQTTVLSYERDLPLLRQRAAASMARTDPSGASAAAEGIVEAARQVLAARARQRARVLALAPAVATAGLPAARKAAPDRAQPDGDRDRWKRAVVDLEALSSSGGAALDAGSFAERLDRIASPEDPPEEEKPHRFELLELD